MPKTIRILRATLGAVVTLTTMSYEVTRGFHWLPRATRYLLASDFPFRLHRLKSYQRSVTLMVHVNLIKYDTRSSMFQIQRIRK
jgi:hypothetical protein